MGTAANAWLAFMDKFVAEGSQGSISKCIDLVDVYYAALDADKTGQKVNFAHSRDPV